MNQENRLIKLGIALDYPVHWGFEKILRDLNQNFLMRLEVSIFQMISIIIMNLELTECIRLPWKQ